MFTLSPGRKILADLRARKALRLSSECHGPLALGDYEDLADEIKKRLPAGTSTANPSEQVATHNDLLDYFGTAPQHEVKIALWGIRGVPHDQIARRLNMSPSVYKAVHNQMMAKWAAHRGQRVGQLDVRSEQSRGLDERERRSG